MQRLPGRDLGRHPGDGVAGGLGGQGRGARDPGVDLDHVVGVGVRVERELDVAAALDPQPPDDPQRRRAQPLQLAVGKGLAGRDHDRVPGVDSHGVQVLHVADREAGVLGVPHHLVLDLLPAQQGPLHQHLPDGAGRQPLPDHRPQLQRGGGDPAPGPAQGEGGPDHQGQAALRRELLRRLDRGNRPALGHRLPQPEQQLLEGLPVLRLADRLQRRPQEPDPVALQHPALGQGHGQVEPGLAPQRGQQSLGPLPLDHRAQRRQRQRLQVDPVRDPRVGHDGGRVGVDQDGAHPLLPERLAGLGPGVVELRRLPDHDRPRADHQHALRLDPLPLHPDRRPTLPRRQRQELVEDSLVVLRPGRAFGMELDRPDGPALMGQAFHRAVVQVAVADPEPAVGRETSGVDLELVVLGGHGHPAAAQVHHRMVPTVVAETQSGGGRARRLADQLMAEADTQDRDPPQQLAGQPHLGFESRRIARTVGENNRVRAPGLQRRRAHVVPMDDHLDAPGPQRAQDVALDPQVHDRDPQPGPSPRRGLDRQRGVERLEAVLEGPRDLAYQVLLLQRRHRSRTGGQLRPQLRRIARPGRDDPSQRARAPQVAHQAAGVDPGEDRDSVGIEPGPQIRLRLPVPGLPAQPPRDQGPGPGTPRLRKGCAHAVIADQWIGHRHHLAGVGRIA